jgi:serine/threonine protein kinase
MEYLVGETLEDVLGRRKQLPPTEAAQLVYQALQGLQHIHEQGLVHRDLKPSNLMLVPPPGANTLGCTVKVLDVGLGRMVDDNADPGLTGEGVLLGTPDYMAPEQARDPRATDIRADIYSLGCVLYHLLAGQPPFPDTNIISQMIRHASETARPLTEINPAIPDGLQQIVNWMMAKTPDGRYPTPARAASALEVFLAAGGPPKSSADDSPEMAPYLTWLEKEDAKVPPSGAAIPVAQVPTQPVVSVPAKPPTGTMPAAPTARPAAKSVKDKHRKKKRPPPPPPAAEASPPKIDVELIALPPPPPPQEPDLFGPPTKRDFLVFFIGVGAAALAWGFGWLLRELFTRLRRPRPEPEPEKEGDT